MKSPFLLALAALTSVSGCGVVTPVSDEKLTADISSAYVGKPISHVIQKEPRTPSRVMNLPDGTSVYVWSLVSTSSSPVTCGKGSKGETTCSGGGVISRNCETSAIVDQAGIVTAMRVSGCSFVDVAGFRLW